MRIKIYSSADAANEAAAEFLAERLIESGTRNVMAAGGNTPLDLYRRIAERKLALGHLRIFVLDEYVGVPTDEPRNCSNLLRRTVAEAWNVPMTQFYSMSSVPEQALTSVREHERKIAEFGGLDIIILGLGQNGHLGFNEPGSAEDSIGRVMDLDAISVEANRKWFHGAYAPAQGVTVGLRTILVARRILILAYGAQKAAAVRSMLDGPRTPACPASFVQGHPAGYIFLDHASAAAIEADEQTARK